MKSCLRRCLLEFRLFFFFQAEDGIRGGHVTGVQTCALPISIVITSTAFEAATFVALVPYMVITDHGLGRSLFLGLFYAISAFNNAGFVPEAVGVEQYLGDHFFSITLALAVQVGSIGFQLLFVVARPWRR